MWELDRSNPYVRKMRESAKNTPGIIGKMGGKLSAHFVLWRIVKELGISLSEAEGMTFDMMMEAVGFIDMRLDYKNAWEEFYDSRKKAVNNGSN